MARPNLLDPKVRASKKKKQAIGLAVLFVAVLAISVPRTMKMMSPPAPETTASSVPASGSIPATSALPTASAPGTVQGVAVATNGEAQLVVADLAPTPLEGQLEDFTAFDAKDPFVQQHVASSRFTPQGTAASTGSAANAQGSAPAAGAETAEPTSVTGSTSAVPSVPTTTAPTTTAPTTQPPTSAAPTQTGAATISVNGVQETVNVASDFPAAAPLFRLVKLTAKAAKISIAGGTLATGAPTVTLELGRSLTLMNTADGTRYVLILVSTAATPAAGASTPTP